MGVDNLGSRHMHPNCHARSRQGSDGQEHDNPKGHSRTFDQEPGSGAVGFLEFLLDFCQLFYEFKLEKRWLLLLVVIVVGATAPPLSIAGKPRRIASASLTDPPFYLYINNQNNRFVSRLLSNLVLLQIF